MTDERIWVQSREDLNFPILTDFGKGYYGLQFSRGRHAGSEWMHMMISHDAGQTWMDDRVRTEVNRHGSVFLTLRNGNVAGFSLFEKHGSDLFGTFMRQIVSVDNGRSWAESFEPAYELRDIITMWNAPVEFSDGTLLSLAYGRGPKDPRQVTAVERKAGETAWRAKSNVFGRHPDTEQGGPNESALALLPTGRVVAVARTGYPDSPLLWSWSDDRGGTWSTAKRLPWSGVDPILYTLDNGVLLLIFGARREDKRTGAMTVVGSTDGGETWSKPFIFYDGPGSSYHSAIRTGPDRLLLAYTESEFRRLELPQRVPEGRFNRIKALTLIVSPSSSAR
jgi:hypothetical protein